MTDQEIKDIVTDLKNIGGDDVISTFFHVVQKHCGTYSKNNGIWLFTQFWFCVPQKHLYDLYKDNLQMVEVGNYYHYFFKPDILEKIAEVNKHDTIDNPALISLLDEDGYLTIYHGHCKPTMRNSNSWTLDKDLANWFGNRNALFHKSQDYYIVTGKVSLNDIIAFIADRNEAEIVVLQKNVKQKTKEFFPKSELEWPKRWIETNNE